MYSFLADALAFAHGIWVLLVVGGPLLSWRWRFFRWVHLAMMAATIGFICLGRFCPFTTLEQFLRSQAGEASYSGPFITHYLEKAGLSLPSWSIFAGLVSWMIFWGALYFTAWKKIQHHDNN